MPMEAVCSIETPRIQSQARWQVAEIAYRLKIEGYLDYLRFLGKDPNDYVRKREKNCLRYEGCAE